MPVSSTKSPRGTT